MGRLVRDGKYREHFSDKLVEACVALVQSGTPTALRG